MPERYEPHAAIALARTDDEATEAARNSRGTIVVADDDTATRMMLCQILRRQHYRVIEVADGSLACAAVRLEHPDVVLLDWSMPVMDGMGVLKVLKADPATRSIPVVMLTTQAQLEDKLVAIEAGAQDFLIKPCHPRELVARIDQQRRWRDVVASDASAEAQERDIATAQAQAVERVRVASEIERLRDAAMRDALTGLPNRLLLHDRVDQAILSSKRRKERFAMLFVDVDGFKAINDRYGHAVGDEALKTVATRITNSVRESDTVARVGGDEFVVLAPRILKPENARELASRLVEALRRPALIGEATVTVSASVGVSLYPIDAIDRERLLQTADIAMYAAKASGKDRYRFANERVFEDDELWEQAFT